ncbi:MAG: hypothetical protein AAGI17_10515 [Planctomycetota bacterium]
MTEYAATPPNTPSNGASRRRKHDQGGRAGSEKNTWERMSSRFFRDTAKYGVKPLEWLGRYLPSGADDGPLSPTADEVAGAEQRMIADPVSLPRPVLVLAGWRAWPMQVHALSQRLGELTGDPTRFHPVAYPGAGSVEKAADRVLAETQDKFGRHLRSIDVVAISMGGLVARYLGTPEWLGGHETPLPIRRLYTLGTPHAGAKLADTIALDTASRQMRPGSAFLSRMNEALPSCGFELTPYAVLNDTWVGAKNSAPPGWAPIWTRGSAFMSHFIASTQPAIIADVALRLRGEAPLASVGSEPPTD